ncbi:MAG: sigma-70 family RNA polymerase sigma factor [Planctomycetota bacterium]
MNKRPAPESFQDLSDEQLVDLTLGGDRNAYSVLITRYWRMVFSLAYRGCRNVTDSEDVTQEAFLAALSSLPKLKDASKFSSWLYGLTLNTTRSFLRKKARTPSLPDTLIEETDEDSPSTLQLMAGDERHEALVSAVESLRPIYRVVVELRYVEGLSCEDIAKRLNEPSGTIRSRLCRATEILRRKLKKHF